MGKMPMFKRSEIVDAITTNGFSPEQGKGSHKKYIHKDFPWLFIVLDKNAETSGNLYVHAINALALLEILTGEPLNTKRISEKMRQDLIPRRKRADIKTLVNLEMQKQIGNENLDQFLESEKQRYKKLKTALQKNKGGRDKK